MFFAIFGLHNNELAVNFVKNVLNVKIVCIYFIKGDKKIELNLQ